MMSFREIFFGQESLSHFLLSDQLNVTAPSAFFPARGRRRTCCDTGKSFFYGKNDVLNTRRMMTLWELIRPCQSGSLEDCL
jgi:hypothetical protein